MRKSVIALIKRIEAEKYPDNMQMLQDIVSIQDIADYCEVDIIDLGVYTYSNGYMLLGLDRQEKRVEIVDMAGKFAMSDLLSVLSSLKEFTGWTVTVDARETTSYRFMQYLVKHGHLEILEDEPWNWDGEIMHAISGYIR